MELEAESELEAEFCLPLFHYRYLFLPVFTLCNKGLCSPPCCISNTVLPHQAQSNYLVPPVLLISDFTESKYGAARLHKPSLIQGRDLTVSFQLRLEMILFRGLKMSGIRFSDERGGSLREGVK